MNRRMLLFSWAAVAAAAKTHLKTGEMAPGFKLPSTTGQPITVGEFRGKKAVVLAFFPAAFTGG
jgi:peroxiredoxin Q/BCP